MIKKKYNNHFHYLATVVGLQIRIYSFLWLILFGEKLIIETLDNGKYWDELSIIVWQKGQGLNSNSV